MEGFALAELIVVVWELEVVPSRMHVHIGAHHVRSHHRALDVPAWPATTPR
jgi:hypothetical protein